MKVCLTRVLNDWFSPEKGSFKVAAVGIEVEHGTTDCLEILHNSHHYGVKRMNILAEDYGTLAVYPRVKSEQS